MTASQFRSPMTSGSFSKPPIRPPLDPACRRRAAQLVVWAGPEDDHILVRTSDAIATAKDMRRDPRVALTTRTCSLIGRRPALSAMRSRAHRPVRVLRRWLERRAGSRPERRQSARGPELYPVTWRDGCGHCQRVSHRARAICAPADGPETSAVTVRTVALAGLLLDGEHVAAVDECGGEQPAAGGPGPRRDASAVPRPSARSRAAAARSASAVASLACLPGKDSRHARRQGASTPIAPILNRTGIQAASSTPNDGWEPAGKQPPDEAVSAVPVTGRLSRLRRRPCTSRAGPGCRGHGHTASWSAGRRGGRFPGMRA